MYFLKQVVYAKRKVVDGVPLYDHPEPPFPYCFFFFFFKEIGALGRCCRQPTLKYGAALSPVTKVRCTNRSLCRGEVALGGGCVVYAVNSLCIPSPWCRAETVSVNRTLIAL